MKLLIYSFGLMIFTFMLKPAQCHCQGFELFYDSPDYDVQFFDVTEDKNGNFIFSGRKGVYSGVYSGLIVKTDHLGNILKQVEYNGFFYYTSFSHIIPIDGSSNFIFLGAGTKLQSDIKNFKDQIILIITDANLNILYQNSFGIAEASDFVDCFTIDGDSNIILGVARIKDSNSGSDIAYYKISQTGDSISTISVTSKSKNLLISAINYNNLNHTFISVIFDNQLNKLITLTDNFDTISITPLHNYNFTGLVSAKLLGEKKIISSRGDTAWYDGTEIQHEHDLNIAFLDKKDSIILLQKFGRPGLRDQEANRSVDFRDPSHIYVAGTSGLEDLFNAYFDTASNKILVVKFDSSGKVYWVKYLGDAGHYFLRTVYATSDNGCILVGGVYSADKYPEKIRKGFVIKMDSNGAITWVRGEQIIDNNSFIIFYDNITQNIIIEQGNQLSSYLYVEIYDIAGRKILFNEIKTSQKIPFINYQPGIYLYSVTDMNNYKVKNGKFVKLK